jgi:hypothetical protein
MAKLHHLHPEKGVYGFVSRDLAPALSIDVLTLDRTQQNGRTQQSGRSLEARSYDVLPGLLRLKHGQKY